MAVLVMVFLVASVGCKDDIIEEQPAVSTLIVSEITSHSAKSGGQVTDDGGSEIVSRGVVWHTQATPSLENFAGMTVDGDGIGVYASIMEHLTPNTSYYVRAYATNRVGTSYGNVVTFRTDESVNEPAVTTDVVTNITQTDASGGGNVTSDGGSAIIARGVCWSTSPSPTVANNTTSDGTGTGPFTSSLTGLSPSTTYYVRAYATNSVGTAYGDQVSFSTTAPPPTYPTGTVHCDPNNPTAIIDITNPTTGKIWMDRNLGASQVATSSSDANSYGDLYQWGRFADGHHCRTSATTSTLSTTPQPAHGNFIMESYPPYDWLNPQYPNLWQGVNGINNPCPTGYRLPTEAELNNERLSWSSNNSSGAFTSPLKLPAAGLRLSGDGLIYGVGSHGYYWSSTVNGTDSRNLYFHGTEADIFINDRAGGNTVRCIKDN